MQRESRTPLIIAVVLLVLPLLYVGSYLALVWPDAERIDAADSVLIFPNYRYGTEAWADVVFWPLEQVDRRIRPKAWGDW